MHHVNSSLPKDGNTSNATFGLAYSPKKVAFTPYYVTTKTIETGEEILGDYLDTRVGTYGYKTKPIKSPSDHLISIGATKQIINSTYNFSKDEKEKYKSRIK